jgi:hypothetical protein
MKRRNRSKTTSRRGADTMLAEYDFTKGVRGQTWRRYAAGTNVVVLDPDNAKVFPNSAAVNDALRVCARLLNSAERKSDAKWDKSFRRSARRLAALADAAMNEHKRRRTRPLDPSR